MQVSAISQSEECKPRRNSFISFTNSFMSMPESNNVFAKANTTNQKSQRLSIENLEAFTIFPKEVVNGKTVITA